MDIFGLKKKRAEKETLAKQAAEEAKTAPKVSF